MEPINTKDPSQDDSSTVTGPFINGELSDCNINNAGESHPKFKPDEKVAILAEIQLIDKTKGINNNSYIELSMAYSVM